jgi:gluconate 2-dehydrogenase gamma chain
MSDDIPPARSRRNFLKQVATLAGGGIAGAATAAAQTAPATAPAASATAPGYMSLSPDEAGFVEAMVNVMCPADGLTPNGVDCGLAVFIDRQLAGAFGRGDRLYRQGPWKQGKPELGYQLPLAPERYFKVGLAAADTACVKKHGKGFYELPAVDADAFLQEVAADKIASGTVPLAEWFNTLVYPLFEQACFGDPMYGGNANKVFWKAIGYPGLPATYTNDMITFRGKPHPGGQAPKSIADFS